MALTKNVNGETVNLTAEEEAAVRAEWAANATDAARPKPPTLDQRLATLETRLAALEARASK